MTIPDGSFRQAEQGTFAFEGIIQGVQVVANVTQAGDKSYTFQIRGTGVPKRSEMPGGNPVDVRLAIGSNAGDNSRPGRAGGC